jgi:hypothetical protein
MTTEPDDTSPSDDAPMDGRGAEIGISEGDGSSFEPEEDPEAQSEGEAATNAGGGARGEQAPKTPENDDSA